MKSNNRKITGALSGKRLLGSVPFGVEKEKGKVEGILAAVYQNVFGGDEFTDYVAVRRGDRTSLIN